VPTAELYCIPVLCRLLAKVGRHLDVMPGEEFRVALREAQAQNMHENWD